MYSLSDYDYFLPETFIAQQPAAKRDHSKLLHLDRSTGKVSHYTFHELCTILSSEDLLVLNNTEVIPGRLFGRKETGGLVEVLVLDTLDRRAEGTDGTVVLCDCLVRASKTPKPGKFIVFDADLKAEVVGHQDGIFRLKFWCDGEFDTILQRIGNVPLPPYIKRTSSDDGRCDDRISYQTVYATQKGAVAAPTAGLHFTRELMKKLKSTGVRCVEITLHVGYGTFLPVKSGDIRDHQIHSERYGISEETAGIINETKTAGGRIVAVGTTSVRTLEYASDSRGRVLPQSGRCDLFIFPGYRFKVVDALITNFHLPRSTLLMLVSAFAGREKVLYAYREAIAHCYRFYSYGDAMYIS